MTADDNIRAGKSKVAVIAVEGPFAVVLTLLSKHRPFREH